ncbi:UNVERIFIED_CONTAM: hypothetical protein GTU68_059884 [Idotea baltica]|nr:hypothetical protein [Idotea baltica]
MRSTKPKVLHAVGGKPILGHVLNCAKNLKPNKIIVIYGYGGEQVKQAFNTESIIWVEQKEQLGTGHAVQQAIPHLDDDANSLILLGDVPLVDVDACKQLIEGSQGNMVVQSFIKSDPTGYGRILRNNDGLVKAIVEHKDATSEQRKVNEVNTGIMAMPSAHLKSWLQRLNNNNAQKEYYLTDIVGFAVEDGINVSASIIDDEWSVTGINSKQDLALIEREHQQRKALALLQKGVTLLDPARIDIRGTIETGEDVEIDVGCIFEGSVILAAGATIAAFTHILEAEVGKNSRVGPYARLRPGTTLADGTHVGNFVELKNAQVGAGSKVNL